MGSTRDGRVQRVQPVELAAYLDRANCPWNPLQVAARHFNALVRDDADVPSLADFDDLYDVADLAMHWIEQHPCPDRQLEQRLRAQMMGFRAVAVLFGDGTADRIGDGMVARLHHLRGVIDLHSQAIDESAHALGEGSLDDSDGEPSILPLRRRVPRQQAGWSGTCLIDGEADTRRRDCRVVDISMLGLGLFFNHPSPFGLVDRRIAVEVSAVEDRVNIRLEGTVRHARVTSGGAIRVGVEFDDDPNTESYRISAGRSTRRRSARRDGPSPSQLVRPIGEGRAHAPH